MVKKFCFYFSFRNGALIMSVISFLTGVALILDCVMHIEKGTAKRYNSFIVVGILMGITSLIAGGILSAAIFKAKERYILLYMLLESVLLLIVTIYSGMFMFTNAAFLLVLIICGLMWLGIVGIYGFYNEIAEYNSSKPGVYEVSYSENGGYRTATPSGQVDSTAV
ncbi:uncharacterized protein LOC123309973 [Coccinella septempunctata]|uniref:uncharacterized protein LOC123309973 n=1 Tax=Coccinella septempunctata TaxID=41139 RepID=UPI001D078C4C|nr:uncharacterized protein LOC123309973 [Coccinella septempunctata]